MICQTCRIAMRSTRTLPRAITTTIARTTTSPTSTGMRSIASSHAATTRMLSTSRTLFSTPLQSDPPTMNEAESAIAKLLQDKLNPTELLVQDISGGCGSMYAIEITSAAFKGLTMLKQQRLVNAALGDVVKQWHGVQMRTKAPDS